MIDMYLHFQSLLFMVEAQLAIIIPLHQEMGEIHACPHDNAILKVLVGGYAIS